MLRTAAQDELTVRMSLQRLPHPYNPENMVTTSSNRIYYVILDSFQQKIGVFLYLVDVLLDSISIYTIYEISIDFSLIRLNRRVGKSAGYHKSPSWT